MDKLFIGMDVYKEKIVVVGLPGEESHSVLREEFNGGNLPRLVKWMKALAASWQLKSCYEAGPCSYGLMLAMANPGISCRVVGPSLVRGGRGGPRIDPVPRGHNPVGPSVQDDGLPLALEPRHWMQSRRTRMSAEPMSMIHSTPVSPWYDGILFTRGSTLPFIY